MAIYGYIYLYMQHLNAQEVCETPSQCIHIREASVHYTKLTQVRCSATKHCTKVTYNKVTML